MTLTFEQILVKHELIEINVTFIHLTLTMT